MLEIIISILGILLTIFFVIGIHESSHFLVARWLNIKVICFSIGFGKTLYRWHDKKGTEYILALIPLGGYVKMVDEAEGKVTPEDLPYAFNRQPFYKKFAVVLAGPLSNLISAFCLYWLLFTIGFTTIVPIIGAVTPHSIAAEAGLKANQEITNIDNHVVQGWMSIITRIFVHIGDNDILKIAIKNPDTTSQIYALSLANWHMDDLRPDPLSSLGIEPYQPEIPLIISQIAPDSAGAHSPLNVGDHILAIDKTPIKDWEQLITIIMSSPAQVLHFTVERQGKMLTLPVTVGYKRSLSFHKYGYLGISPEFHWPPQFLRKIQYGVFAAIPHAWNEEVNFFYLNWISFEKIIEGKVSFKSLGGPITIFQSAGNALNSGFVTFISFLAFLSIAIGFINLLPIPGLDGGHLLFQIIELIRRRPIPLSIQLLCFRMGFILLFIVIIQALANDILRL
ncbi:MAG: RIP metalloprotease RseP [Gammaproteobacteria bacterium RIFCSPHIGHO2_12_FULL_42_13]|nr:MAG: RIP metalloprotease RseP [Gammaproteobacteria bacterium RIFCSPHIGHO2_12_FULL_42_13]